MKYIFIIAFILLSCQHDKAKRRTSTEVKKRPTIAEVQKPSEIRRYKPKIQPFGPLKPLNGFKGDTIAYFQTNFVDRTSAYYNKPFGNFLADLDIPIKRFNTLPSKDKKMTEGVILHFVSHEELRRRVSNHQSPLILFVYWERSQPSVQSRAFLEESMGVWNDAAQKFFSDKKIGYITIVKNRVN